MPGIGVHLDTSQVRRFGGLLEASAAAAPARARAGVRKTTQKIEDAAKGNCPVLTGELRDSITSTVTGLKGTVGPTARYGDYVEYGTSVMSPEPYLGPAFDQYSGELGDNLARELTAAL